MSRRKRNKRKKRKISSMVTQISECITKKKCFPSREAAEQFAANLKSTYPERTQQYAYGCEDCPNWHLSTLSPEAYELSKSRPTPMVPPADRKDTKREQILDLKRQGLSINKIARQTGVAYQTAYHHCINAGLHVPTSLGTSSGTRPSIKPALTVESLSAEERELQTRLDEIQRKRQQLIEAKALKIGPCSQGIRIEKEGNILTLSFADAEQLIEKLSDYLTAPQPPAARAADSAGIN